MLWAFGSLGMRQKVGALTDSRLLLFPLSEPDAAPQVLVAPYTLQTGKKKILGQAVRVRDARGTQADLLLSPQDYQELDRAAGSPQMSDVSPGIDAVRPELARAGRATGGGSWRWTQSVLSWEHAERMAADHMRHLGFSGVTITPRGRDNGLDVISRTGAAQVKFHALPSGAPDVQRLRGAADGFATRLFYATAYTPAAFAATNTLGVAAFQFTADGGVVAVNATSRQLVTSQAPPATPPERGVFGQLTREARQQRALEWAQQIQSAAETPISNRKRKGARQLAERQQALQLMVAGLAQLEDSENPLYKNARKNRTESPRV